MPISIKNEEAETVARRLAELTGETITAAICSAVTEKYERLRRTRAGRPLSDDLNEIAQRCSRRRVISDLSDDEILGYDEEGLPR